MSFSNVEVVSQYIGNQEKHHKSFSWEHEYRKLLEKHGIDFDERYYLD